MISKRLTALAAMIPDNEIVADIGCDHALLLCRLAEENRLKKGYAIDIAKGPLQQAKKNIEAGDHDNITVILADGLRTLPADTTMIVISGLGFHTIKRILETDWDRLKKLVAIIVQCNSEISEFRSFLSKQRVNITAEKWIKDRHDYQLIKFDLKKQREYRENESFFGPFLLKERPPEFLAYYRRLYQKLLLKYRFSDDPLTKNKLTLIEENLKEIF